MFLFIVFDTPTRSLRILWGFSCCILTWGLTQTLSGNFTMMLAGEVPENVLNNICGHFPSHITAPLEKFRTMSESISSEILQFIDYNDIII